MSALRQEGVEPDAVVLLDVPDDILVERCEGRRLDPSTGSIYHLLYNPPPPEIIDRLVHRSDDTAEAMVKRIAMYHNNIAAILTFYLSKVAPSSPPRPPLYPLYTLLGPTFFFSPHALYLTQKALSSVPQDQWGTQTQ